MVETLLCYIITQGLHSSAVQCTLRTAEDRNFMEKVENRLKRVRSLLSSTTQIKKQMSLFPEENILTKEIESWRVFADGLKSEEDKKLFLDMLEKCQKYSIAINTKGKPFPTEPLIMALLLLTKNSSTPKGNLALSIP
jgi:hypothetical protein